jgi:hypothetical protein
MNGVQKKECPHSLIQIGVHTPKFIKSGHLRKELSHRHRITNGFKRRITLMRGGSRDERTKT